MPGDMPTAAQMEKPLAHLDKSLHKPSAHSHKGTRPGIEMPLSFVYSAGSQEKFLLLLWAWAQWVPVGSSGHSIFLYLDCKSGFYELSLQPLIGPRLRSWAKLSVQLLIGPGPS